MINYKVGHTMHCEEYCMSEKSWPVLYRNLLVTIWVVLRFILAKWCVKSEEGLDSPVLIGLSHLVTSTAVVIFSLQKIFLFFHTCKICSDLLWLFVIITPWWRIKHFQLIRPAFSIAKIAEGKCWCIKQTLLIYHCI